MYYFQRDWGRLEELMETCACNNADFWDELAEPAPSLPKLRSLATRYRDYSETISNTYDRIRENMLESSLPVLSYLHFLLQVGADAREALRRRD